MSVSSGVDVTPLRLARVELPAFHPGAPGSDPVYAFLVRDGASCILVDTGVGDGSELIDRLYRPERVPLGDALAEAGASLAGVTAVVNSHLHFDHCGNNRLFPGVPIFVQRAELEAARQPHYTVPEWLDFPGARYVPVDGVRSISPRVELRPTRGHTPGHQSVFVRTDEGVEIVAAQAAYSADEFQAMHDADDADRGGPALEALRRHVAVNGADDEAAYLASLAELRDRRPRRAYFSHDAAVWERMD